MPQSTKAPARRRSPARTRRTVVRASAALMVIDHERLQSAAWAEYHTARKRLEKAARDLHRHEEIDVPAFETWLHRTFPIFITTLRELHAEVAAKACKVQAVTARAALFGGSLKRLWRQQKEREANPEAFRDEDTEGFGEEEYTKGRRHDAYPDDFERAPGPTPTRVARDIYRRLVQRLHPDRGGGWTTARQRLWHEVQQAWSQADADWLARLESEWENANETVSHTSPLSRLRRAIEELHAARRDTERKLSGYRLSPQWRFTRNEKTRAQLHARTESAFTRDIAFLRRQLDHLNRTIAAWEDDWTRAASGRKTRHHRTRRY